MLATLAPATLFAFAFQAPAPHTQFAPQPVPKYVCESDILLMGEGGGDHHGWSLASGGNWHDTVSGTPGSDLLVGTFHKLLGPEFFDEPPSYLDSSHQFVSLYLSPFDWSNPCPGWHYRIRIHGEQEGDRFGFSVAFIGDVDGDGFDDFAAAAVRGPKNALPPPDNPWEEYGKVFVFLSGDEGIPFRPSQLCLDSPPCSNAPGSYSAATASLILKGEREGDRLGHSLAGIGDWNGDGKPDFVVGAPGGVASSSAST